MILYSVILKITLYYRPVRDFIYYYLFGLRYGKNRYRARTYLSRNILSKYRPVSTTSMGVCYRVVQATARLFLKHTFLDTGKEPFILTMQKAPVLPGFLYRKILCFYVDIFGV